MIIKDLPLLERPREKAFKYGFNKLSNNELLCIILEYGTKGKSVIDLSYDILNKFDGILGLKNTNLEELKSIKGISDAKATKLLAIIELSKRLNDNYNVGMKINDGLDVYNLIGDSIKYEPQENFVLILLDIKNKLINYQTLYKGGLNYNVIHMRDVFREIVKYNAHKFICVHNHPTGDPSPSEQDVITTKEILNTSKIMGIKFMDHIIIGDNCYFSFKESSTLLDQ